MQNEKLQRKIQEAQTASLDIIPTCPAHKLDFEFSSCNFAF
jgi:predicted GNAT family acetyltransferase